MGTNYCTEDIKIREIMSWLSKNSEIWADLNVTCSSCVSNSASSSRDPSWNSWNSSLTSLASLSNSKACNIEISVAVTTKTALNNTGCFKLELRIFLIK